VVLLVVLPVAAVGAVVWWPPYYLVSVVPPRFKPKLDQVATYKFAAGLMTFPTWLFLVVLGVWFAQGTRAALLTLAVLPMTAFATIAWRERQHAVRQDLRVFAMTRRRRRGRDRLGGLREGLVAEFDALIEEWRADHGG